jgi:hypothetical protein
VGVGRLQLDGCDDVFTICDRLNWVNDREVLIVSPAEGRVLTRTLDLVRVLRHAKALGIQISLVTTDKDLIYDARKLGLPVYRRVEAATPEHFTDHANSSS